jgi:Zn finger protein HypA/HybF involved in hydrogenase expression
MELHLTCAHCNTQWTVQYWRPEALRCPRCHGAELSDGLSLREEQARIAKKDAVRRRKRLGVA